MFIRSRKIHKFEDQLSLFYYLIDILGNIDHLTNEITFCDWMGKKLGIKSMNDWYKITNEDISKYGGDHYLDRYGGSIFNLLRKVYCLVVIILTIILI